MLSFENYANYGTLQPSGLECASSDDEDNGETKPMAEGQDEDEATPLTEELGPLPLADTSMLVFNHDNGTFHFDKRHLAKISPVAVSAMLAYNKSEGEKMKDSRERIVALICMQPCLPAIVPGSPLISLLENTTPPDIEPVVKHQFVSFGFSAFQLLEYKVALCDDVLPVALSDEAKAQIINEYKTQMLLNERQVNDQLDALYARQAKPPIEEFVQITENFCITFINELERFIFRCLVEPFASPVKLEHVLTPRTFGTLKQVLPFEKREQVVRDMVRFFDYKRSEQKMETLQTQTLFQEMQQAEENSKYKGYVLKRTVEEYMVGMNIYEEEQEQEQTA